MVDLVINQRKNILQRRRARAKRNKPMTQSQLKTYMMNYLKNQGTWKLSQLKNLSFEEVKKEFDKLVKQDDEPNQELGKKKNRWQGGLHYKVLIRMTLKDSDKLDMGWNGPEDELEKVFGNNLKNILTELLARTIWSELGQQRVDMVINPPWNLPFLGAKGLTSPEQTATGKGISNPFMAVMVCQKPYGIQLTNVSSTES
ncbi:hypothetical protein Tco_0577716 [Tanacetum coccineum]